MSVGAHFVRVPGSRFQVPSFRSGLGFGIWDLNFRPPTGLWSAGLWSADLRPAAASQLLHDVP